MSRIGLPLILVAALASSLALAARADDQAMPKTRHAWTLNEAQQQLTLHPKDAYLQYVVLQLAMNEDRQQEASNQIRSLTRRRQRGREQSVDLFALFSAAHAIQETLQLDAMQGDGTGLVGEMGDPTRETVNIGDLTGPTVKSHPWGKMLAAQNVAGKKHESSKLAHCVPEDQYFVLFGSVEKLLQFAELGDRWGAHVLAQTVRSGTTSLTSSRVKTQLAVQTDPFTRPFYDVVVDEVAMTGNDLYFRAGSDMTLLFQLKQPEVFRMRMDGFLKSAEGSFPDATRTTGQILDVPYVQVATPDRSVNVFSAYPRPDLHLRSNSREALERVLATIQGKAIRGDSPVARLGESTEFKYIRTLMQRGATEEDGFVYLSDPFIRRLVGPELKLTNRRRMLCYNHLRMAGHSQLLFQTQYGRPAKSLQELQARGCAPGIFGETKYRCPDGGRYRLDADGQSAVCSHHGHAGSLTPCCEIPVPHITKSEADQYRQFVDRYSQYWRRFFDPIAIRIRVTPEQYRAETIILPLIDNSIYSGLATALGGEPEPLDTLPVPKRNIFSLVARWNQEQLTNDGRGRSWPFLLNSWRNAPKITDADGRLFLEFLQRGIGSQVGMHVYDTSPTFDFSLTQFMGEMVREFRGRRGGMDGNILYVSFLVASLNAPVYIAMPVEDADLVDRFLERLDVYMAEVARTNDEQGWFDLNIDFYRVPLTGAENQVRCFSIAFGPVKWRMFFARVGDGLYVASKRFILEDLQAMQMAEAPPSDSQGSPSDAPAHAMLRIRSNHWDQVLPMFRLGWAEASRESCLNNLGPLSSVHRAVAATESETNAQQVVARANELHAVHFYCPDGGQYVLSADGKQISCNLHGTPSLPHQGAAPSPKSPMDQLLDEFHGATLGLTFLEDGLHAVVTVDRE